MAKNVPLDKILVQGTVYTTDDREAWIIKKVGTNSSSIGYLKIDEKPTTQLSSVVSALHKTSSSFLDLLDLGADYNVVPPNTKIEWVGGSGSKLRVKGIKVQLDAQEKLDATYLDRFSKQTLDYIVVVENSYSHGTGTDWAYGLEKEVISLTPKTIEKYIFDNLLMASIANVSGGVAEGDWVLRIYYENAPDEFVYGTNIKHGIDILSLPRPPANTTEDVPFTLGDFPKTVEGDHTLSLRVANVSGYSKSPTSGNSITVTVTAVARYIKSA